MKIRVTFCVDDECRMAVARYLDGRQWNGKRKATREEIEGVIADGGENSLEQCIADFNCKVPFMPAS
jgi:hypothetical protein